MYKKKSIVVKIESNLKDRVENIFQSLGMTTNQAISIFFKQVELKNGLPFEIKLPDEPNELTKQTLDKSSKGEDVTIYKSKQDLFASWDNI